MAVVCAIILNVLKRTIQNKYYDLRRFKNI